ncbi:glycosyltransferase family 2 protein [Demequina sp. TMPB413]|uniref:glycosyltransferase family 2 protein n=2 Tax=unclassified Demequina TaxID=2620311 RepID=UPI002009F5C2|nr:glycosyltransferase family 2 protein [Demequina sp. TMPB413]UPU88278.1 glycosyltransferase family 2 protein [Demequina sp. TMPB413]
MTQAPRVSIVIPAYNEGENIVAGLDRIVGAVESDFELLVVVDTDDDTTIPVVNAYPDGRVRTLVQTYGRGPANAIRYGIDAASANTTVVTMADGCDDPEQIDDLVKLIERGVVVAAASRYMAGGQQVGGPRFKAFLSRTAGRTLYWFAGVGTRDATNSYKAYDTEFVRRVGIESRDGFEIGLELAAKARRHRQPVAEIPTIWLDRTVGQSNFHMSKWIPKYLRWYFYAYGVAKPLPSAAGPTRTSEGTQHG